jgi:hypothetical protein
LEGESFLGEASAIWLEIFTRREAIHHTARKGNIISPWIPT